MIEVLQVSCHEIPEAIHIFQHALGREVEELVEDAAVFSEETEPLDLMGLTNLDSGAGTRAMTSGDILHKKFLESGIKALWRMAKGTGLSLPPWTIMKLEVNRGEKIGTGLFSMCTRGCGERHPS